MLPFFTQAFLYGFGFDAMLSFWCEVYSIRTGAVANLRNLLALSALVQGTFLYIAMTFTPRISFRLVGWPTLFLIWANLTGGFPLPLFYWEYSGVLLSSLQLAIAVALAVFVWRNDGIAGGPGFVDPAEGRTGFTWRRFLFFTAGNLAAIPLFLVAGLLGSAAHGIDRATESYVRLRPDGIYMAQSRLTKEDREVALKGMVHVADASFYQDLQWKIEGVKTLVLLEGVTDHQGLLKSGLGMEKVASLLGLESQMDRGVYRETIEKMGAKVASGESLEDATITVEPLVDVRRADVDVSSFKPSTISYLKAAASLFQASSSEELLRILQDRSSPLQNDQIAQGVMTDILGGRNNYLIGQIEDGLRTHQRIVVPWGALHLGEIERHLKKRGFIEKERVEAPAILFWKKKAPAPGNTKA